MINIKSEQDLDKMRTGGRILNKILENLLAISKPGVSLIEIESEAQKQIKKAGGSASFMTVEGYSWATCLCVNDVVVHGIPDKYILKESDILTIDIGLLYEQYHTDTASTKIITNYKEEVAKRYPFLVKFLEIGFRTLESAISVVKPGNRIGHISKAIQDNIESAGFSIVKNLVGHGIGKELHEDIQIPGFIKGSIEDTELLKPGMTIAIEVIYAQGKGSVVYANDDGWTIATRDRSLSSVFEHTVAVVENGAEILT